MIKKYLFVIIVFFCCAKTVYANGCQPPDWAAFEKEVANSAHAERVMKALNNIKEYSERTFINFILNNLDLSEKQSKELFEILKKRDEYITDYFERLNSYLEGQLDCFTKFMEEDIKNLGFSQDVEMNTKFAEERVKYLIQSLDRIYENLKKESCDILNYWQIEVIENIEIPDNPLKVIISIRSPAKSNSNIPNVVRKNNALDMKKFLALKYLSEELGARIGLKYKSYSKPKSLEQIEKKVDDIRADINLINLINGMNFTTKQLSLIRNYAISIRNFSEYNKITSREYSSLLSLQQEFGKLYQYMKIPKNLNIENNLFREVNKSVNEFSIAVNDRKTKYKGKFENKYAKPINYLANYFSKGQKEVLFRYNPCLIPPTDLKNPVMVGQANEEESFLVKLLKEVRQMSDEQWRNEKDVVLDKVYAHFNVKDKIENSNVEVKKRNDEIVHFDGVSASKKILQIFDETRRLSTEGFEFEKEEMANKVTEIIDRLRPQDIKNLESTVREKINQTISDKRIIKLIEEIVREQRKIKIETVKLDEVEAEMCEDGNCAIDEEN